MSRGRDRLVAGLAVLAVLALGALIVSTVFDAQRNGRRALERLQVAQVNQLAASTDAQVQTSLQSARQSIATMPFSFRPGDQGDADRLRAFAAGGTGSLLVDANGTVVNGVLIEKPVVGRRYPDPRVVDLVRDGRSGLLPVQPGLTTSAMVVPVVVPTAPTSGRGAVVFESAATPESSFNQSVKELGRGDTGEFSYLDGTGTVVASSDPSRIGRTFPRFAVLEHRTPGFHRGGGKVAAVADMPRTGWQAVFVQDTGEFEGGLTRPLRSAVLLVALAALVVGAGVFVALVRRLRAARDEQRRLARINAAQEEFISIVSHELRTPITGLLGFLQTTIDHWDVMDDDARRQAVARAFANGRRLQSLTADVLDTARIESGELAYSPSRLDLREEVRAAVAAAGDLDPGRPVSLLQPASPVFVDADADRLQQVLTNLLDNALKHTPGGSPVTVTVSVADGSAVVAVADEGPGIAPDEVARVFDKFVRGRGGPLPRGTGLGLYISRQIVEAHGGRIWAGSGPTGGAVLTFSLPLAGGTAADGSAERPQVALGDQLGAGGPGLGG